MLKGQEKQRIPSIRVSVGKDNPGTTAQRNKKNPVQPPSRPVITRIPLTGPFFSQGYRDTANEKHSNFFYLILIFAFSPHAVYKEDLVLLWP